MRILVTGASGLVGRAVLAVLPDTATTFTLSRATGPGPRHRSVDITRPEAVASAVADVAPDCVVHLAAVAQAGPDPDTRLFEVNVDGAVHVAEALWRARPDARLVAVSTGYVLGETDGPADEASPVRPVGAYAESKARMEQALRALSVGRDLCIVRPFNHTGPGQSSSYAVPAFAEKVAALAAGNGLRRLEVGDLSAVRDYGDVRDLGRVLAKLTALPEPPPLLHVCSGVGRSMGSVLEDLLWMVGVSADSVDLQARGHSPLRSNIGDPSLLRRLGLPTSRPWTTTLADVLSPRTAAHRRESKGRGPEPAPSSAESKAGR